MKTKTRPNWLDEKEYPFKDHYFSTPQGNMHYVDEGTGDPIVLLHGNPGWSFEYRKIINEMSRTHRCIAPDYIGFGLSDKPGDWDYLPINHAKHVEDILDSLSLNNITFVFNDWGGPFAMSYAIMALPKSLDKNCPSWRYVNKICQNHKSLLSTRSQNEKFLTLVKPCLRHQAP